MRYLDLIASNPLVWALFLTYVVATSWLAWKGHKKTTDMASFSIGRGDMPAWVVGITLAASIASTATFVINPGFVYVHGISALMHLGVAAGLGITTGLIVMSVGFRRIGAKTAAITLPQWVGNRFGSRPLAIFFAAINLLSLTFVVLIIGGISIVMQQVMGLTNLEALVFTIVFVFSYIFVGGTYAHAYTNTLQGLIMTVVTVIILASGLRYLGDGLGPFLAKIGQKDPNLLLIVNPTSALFSSTFSIFVCGFVIGFALVCQPHIMTKALYVKSDREVWKYLGVCFGVSILFTSLLLIGLWAHLASIPAAALIDPATGAFRQDLVVAAYLATTFGPVTLALVSIAILAAGMSTLDGILVALSSIASNDIVMNLVRSGTEDQRRRLGHRVSQGILVVMGGIAFWLALHPPRLLGIFGQLGVYGIVAASAVPILFGILFPSMGKHAATAAAAAGLAVHFALTWLGRWALANGVDLAAGSAEWPAALRLLADTRAIQLGLLNPAVTATYGLLASAVAGAIGIVLARRRTVERLAAEPAA
jgi:SSS family solute:Na+ symporter/sodium/pantothenate symporter